MLPKFDEKTMVYRIEVDGVWYTVKDAKQIDHLISVPSGPPSWISVEEGMGVLVKSTRIGVIKRMKK
jgi:hypothetical protein